MKDRVLMYIQTPHRGGALKSSLLLTEGLRRKGYEVILVANKKGTVKLEEELITLGGNDFTRPFKLKKIIEDLKPKAVISNIFTQNITAGLTKFLLSEELRKDIKFIAVERTTDFSINRGQWYKLPYRIFIKKIYENFDYIVAVSNLTKKDLIRAFFLKENKIKVIHNPLDIKKIKELALEDIDNKFQEIYDRFKIIVNASRFSKQKRLDLLIKAFSKLVRRRKNIKLVLIGEGEEKENIKRLIKDLKLNNEVLLIPFQKNPFPYIKRAYMFVITSEEEGFPRAVIESLACGTPVVGYYNEYSGHMDIIKDGYNGFLVPYGNEEELIRKIELLLDDEELYCRMRYRGMLSVRKFHTDRIIKKWVELIER